VGDTEPDLPRVYAFRCAVQQIKENLPKPRLILDNAIWNADEVGRIPRILMTSLALSWTLLSGTAPIEGMRGDQPLYGRIQGNLAKGIILSRDVRSTG